jgi:hypothetical protein
MRYAIIYIDKLGLLNYNKSKIETMLKREIQ